MTLLVVLVVLAVVFGVGAVVEGLAWALLIAIVSIGAAAWLGWRKLKGMTRST